MQDSRKCHNIQLKFYFYLNTFQEILFWYKTRIKEVYNNNSFYKKIMIKHFH